ncbi:MAG: hypothetical protein ABEI13_01300 [Candidatus Paceibacteria bacterium]
MVSIPKRNDVWNVIKELAVWVVELILSAYNYLASGIVGGFAGAFVSTGNVNQEYIAALAVLSLIFATLEKEIKVLHPNTYRDHPSKKLEDIESKIDNIVENMNNGSVE